MIDQRAARDLANNAGRVAQVAEIDGAIEAWTLQRCVDAALATLGAARMPAGKVCSAKDHQDPHCRARDMILRQPGRDGHAVDMPGSVSSSATPRALRTPAPHLGEDADAVWRELRLSDEQIAALRQRGVA